MPASRWTEAEKAAQRTRLKTIRAQLDLTQEQAAELVGITRQGWQKLELAERKLEGMSDNLLSCLFIPGVIKRLQKIAKSRKRIAGGSRKRSGLSSNSIDNES